MNEKVSRYDSYYLSNEWHSEPWHPTNKKVLPAVMLLVNRYLVQYRKRFCEISSSTLQQSIGKYIRTEKRNWKYSFEIEYVGNE